MKDKFVKSSESYDCPCSNMQQHWHHLEIKNWVANIVFTFSKLQRTLCSLWTTIQTNHKQKIILENKGIWKYITMYKSHIIENDLHNGEKNEKTKWNDS
jgi:hypothetical protein